MSTAGARRASQMNTKKYMVDFLKEWLKSETSDRNTLFVMWTIITSLKLTVRWDKLNIWRISNQ